MRIIETDIANPDDFSEWEKDQIYNGLDICVTGTVLNALLPQLDNNTAATYSFSKALQGPVLEMRLRGIRIDGRKKNAVIEEFFNKIDFLGRNLDRIILEGCGLSHFNWRSNKDLIALFYTHLGIPMIKRQGRPTVNRDALERLEDYMVAKQIVAHLITMRELQKKIDVLRTEIDPDGRMRTSYNIAGTETGRFSSSYSEFGTGTNLQNIEESLRPIFIADKGMKMAKFDAKSGESYIVGAIEWNLFQDPLYLDACDSGDVHTAVAKMCWPNLPWTGDLKRDKDIAEQPFYRHYTYRFMCKKLGHGSNYGGRPNTLARQAKLAPSIVDKFQPLYFKAFPSHLEWHRWVWRQLREFGYLISLTGRKRHFWGRREDDSTWREAVAFDPQGSLADIVNTAMLRIWRDNTACLYMHDHDALTLQYPEEQEDEIIPQILERLKVPIPLEYGRELLIPFDCKTGWNKGDYNERTNPSGLKDYKPEDKRKRAKEISILDR